MKTNLFAAALIASATMTIGCTSLECTEIGCNDGVTIKIAAFSAAVDAASKPFPIKVKACVDSACQDLTVEEKNGSTTCSVSGEGDCFVDDDGALVAALYTSVAEEPNVTVDVKDAMGQSFFSDSKKIETIESQPNGPQCEPTCHMGDAEFLIPVK
jgi:hypothetical protein